MTGFAAPAAERCDGASPLTLTVCICTYRRPRLSDCLDSVFGQHLPVHVTLDVVVVDNCADGSAASIVRCAETRYGVVIDYRREPARNLSRVRNAALDAAGGDVVALIDDDERASPAWLATMLECLRRHDAHGVIGPVHNLYSEECPGWIAQADLMARPSAPTGRRLRVGHAGNALLLRSVLDVPGARFDERFGQMGGEDTDFFLRLTGAGVRLVACREAIVYELIDPARENMAYLVRENRRIGQVFCLAIWPSLGPVQRVRALAVVFVKIAVFGTGALLTLPFGIRLSAWWRLRCLCNLEKIRYLVSGDGEIRPYGL